MAETLSPPKAHRCFTPIGAPANPTTTPANTVSRFSAPLETRGGMIEIVSKIAVLCAKFVRFPPSFLVSNQIKVWKTKPLCTSQRQLFVGWVQMNPPCILIGAPSTRRGALLLHTQKPVQCQDFRDGTCVVQHVACTNMTDQCSFLCLPFWCHAF